MQMEHENCLETILCFQIETILLEDKQIVTHARVVRERQTEAHTDRKRYVQS